MCALSGLSLHLEFAACQSANCPHNACTLSKPSIRLSTLDRPLQKPRQTITVTMDCVKLCISTYIHNHNMNNNNIICIYIKMVCASALNSSFAKRFELCKNYPFFFFLSCLCCFFPRSHAVSHAGYVRSVMHNMNLENARILSGLVSLCNRLHTHTHTHRSVWLLPQEVHC